MLIKKAVQEGKPARPEKGERASMTVLRGK